MGSNWLGFGTEDSVMTSHWPIPIGPSVVVVIVVIVIIVISQMHYVVITNVSTILIQIPIW